LTWGNAEGSNCPDFVLPIITQYGGDVYKLDDLSDPDVSWDSEPVINALALVQRLAQAGVFVDGINGVTDAQATQLIYQDRAAMFFSGSWMPGTIATEAPPEFADSYYVAKTPALTADGVHWAGDGSGDGWVLNAQSPNYDLAVDFLTYLFSPDTYAIHIRGSQNMPSMPSALQYVDNAAVKEMTGWLDTDGTDHILFGQGSWDAVSGVCSAMLDGSMTPEDGAAQIQADVMATRSRS
jgi:ABC-type glycerol-3-phosphate transport system substrate-binding protein